MQLSPRGCGDQTEPLPPFSTFAAVIAFPCAPRWTNELRKYSGNSEDFWTLCNVSTLAFGKGTGSADVRVGEACYLTLRWEINCSVSPLCHVFSWQTLNHGIRVRSSSSGLVCALIFYTHTSVLHRNIPCRAEQVPVPLLKDEDLNGQHKFYFLCRKL